jgi:hypothetical protein
MTTNWNLSGKWHRTLRLLVHIHFDILAGSRRCGKLQFLELKPGTNHPSSSGLRRFFWIPEEWAIVAIQTRRSSLWSSAYSINNEGFQCLPPNDKKLMIAGYSVENRYQSSSYHDSNTMLTTLNTSTLNHLHCQMQVFCQHWLSVLLRSFPELTLYEFWWACKFKYSWFRSGPKPGWGKFPLL